MREKYTTREKEPLNEWASDRKLKYRRPPYRYMYNTHTHITCGIIKNHTTLLTYIIRSEYFRIDSACGCPYCVEMV